MRPDSHVLMLAPIRMHAYVCRYVRPPQAQTRLAACRGRPLQPAPACASVVWRASTAMHGSGTPRSTPTHPPSAPCCTMQHGAQAGDRRKAQIQQNTDWWAEQTAIREAIGGAEREAEQAHAELVKYQDMLAQVGGRVLLSRAFVRARASSQ